MIIDSHAHLDDVKFDEDRDELIKSLKENGVGAVLNIGCDMESSRESVRLADKYSNIWAVVGIHPHSASEASPEAMLELEELSKNKKVLAIGEIGLDYYYDNSPRDIQKEWFREQIKLSKKLDLPIVVHSRDATKDTLDIIKEEIEGLRGIMHCYSGSVETMEVYMKMGFYISLGGVVSFKKSIVPKEVAKAVPLDRLLLETDSPYMTPEPFRGKRNEPKYTKYVAETIADLRGISKEELIKVTRENTERFFNFKMEG